MLRLANTIRRHFAQAGSLLTWGQTTHGWGRPIDNQYWTPGKVENFRDVVSVSTGQYHLAFLTSDNAVYTTGLNEDGRLGQTSSVDVQLPRRLAFDDPSAKITKISCGARHSLALTQNGTVYSWGYEEALGVEGGNPSGGPVRIAQEHFQNDTVVDVAAARDFSVALCNEGHFYVWGSGLRNLPMLEISSVVPRPVEKVAQFLDKRHAHIKKMAAIDTFILILLDNGRLYSLGRNRTGLFGARRNPLVNSDYVLSSFTKIYDELFHNEKIVDFQASAGSLIFRTETDRIFYNGMYSKYQPTPFPHNPKAKSIFATEASVGVVTEDNRLLFVNDKTIDDSECLCPNHRLYECEDPRFSGQVLALGGTYGLRYALVK